MLGDHSCSVSFSIETLRRVWQVKMWAPPPVNFYVQSAPHIGPPPTEPPPRRPASLFAAPALDAPSAQSETSDVARTGALLESVLEAVHDLDARVSDIGRRFQALESQCDTAASSSTSNSQALEAVQVLAGVLNAKVNNLADRLDLFKAQVDCGMGEIGAHVTEHLARLVDQTNAMAQVMNAPTPKAMPPMKGSVLESLRRAIAARQPLVASTGESNPPDTICVADEHDTEPPPASMGSGIQGTGATQNRGDPAAGGSGEDQHEPDDVAAGQPGEAPGEYGGASEVRGGSAAPSQGDTAAVRAGDVVHEQAEVAGDGAVGSEHIGAAMAQPADSSESALPKSKGKTTVVPSGARNEDDKPVIDLQPRASGRRRPGPARQESSKKTVQGDSPMVESAGRRL